MSDDPKILGKGKKKHPTPSNSVTVISFHAIFQYFDLLQALHFNYVKANEEYQQSLQNADISSN